VDLWDETGRHTYQQFDALGHMNSVYEPDPTVLYGYAGTAYTYDVFGDLLYVNQSGSSVSDVGKVLLNVVRNFAYDMPSRVTFACNPEALAAGQQCSSTNTSVGTTYRYDFNSNLTSKTDNRGITTTYNYDALNRLLSKSYTNDPSGTASSCYLYDSVPKAQYGSGRLGAQWTQKGTCTSTTGSGVLTQTTISLYDAMGRLMNEQRCTGANCYLMKYTYDLAGKLLTYPSGYGTLNFTNSYDAVGHLSSVTQSGQNLFLSPAYTPAGALSGAQLGAAFNMCRAFDSRQRVTGEADVTSSACTVP
jgi:YD repeat-containing protein